MEIGTIFTALEQHDLETLSKLLHDDFKGFRFVNEDVVYTKQELLDYVRDHSFLYTNISIKQNGTTSIIDATNDNQQVTLKLKVKDGRLYQVYEVEKLTQKHRVKCVVSYDGSMFNGYQKQPQKNTVQDALEDAIYKVTNERVTIHSSGRTDAGVHANNQVIHFDTGSSIPASNIYKLINKHVPDSIHIKQSTLVHETFHSRYDITLKEYVYIIDCGEYDVTRRNYVWFQQGINKYDLTNQLETLIGTHDFASFTKTTDKNTVRTIYNITVEQDKNQLTITINGNGFLRYMIRNIVGYAVSYLQGKSTYSIKQILDAKNNNICKDIAPAAGLYMNKVVYDE